MANRPHSVLVDVETVTMINMLSVLKHV